MMVQPAGRLGPEQEVIVARFHPVESEGAIVFQFDARGVARRLRHSAILAALEALRPGETMRLISESDLTSLLADVRRRCGNAVTARSVEQGPDRVVVDLTRS